MNDKSLLNKTMCVYNDNIFLLVAKYLTDPHYPFPTPPPPPPPPKKKKMTSKSVQLPSSDTYWMMTLRFQAWNKSRLPTYTI